MSDCVQEERSVNSNLINDQRIVNARQEELMFRSAAVDVEPSKDIIFRAI